MTFKKRQGDRVVMNTLERDSECGARELAQYDPLTMAIAIIMERVRGLPREDREDLFALAKELPNVQSREDYDSIGNAVREILEQRRGGLHAMAFPEDATTDAGLKKWTAYASDKIKEYRTKADLTQEELAERSGLPQSHISRLENRLHSPSRATLEKIAKALGRSVSDFDPLV